MLYAIGYDILREYRYDAAAPSLEVIREVRLPGPTGHELSPGSTDDELLLSIDNEVLTFNNPKTGS